jgi:hypothetical protein
MTQPEKESIERVETALMDVEVQTRDLPTRNELDRAVTKTKQSGHVAIAVSVILAFLIGMGGVVIGYVNARDIAPLAADSALNKASIDSLNEANEKLKDAGLPQIPVPPNGEAVNANALAQAAAALVLADPRFAGLTLADLRRQVDDYFREHPLPEGQKPTPDQVIQAVTTICADGACKGRPPTPGEISASVSAYCANDACRGQPGVNGQPGNIGPEGRGPTPSEIDDSVERYCSVADRCRGEKGESIKGDPGVDGPKPIDGYFERNDSGICQYATVYDNQTVIRATVPTEMCGTPPPTTEPPVLPLPGN